MKKVDPPKVHKKGVDSLTEEEAIRFFGALLACDFEFRCILQVLITTGLRRGECLGLQWGDIDLPSDYEISLICYIHIIPKNIMKIKIRKE